MMNPANLMLTQRTAQTNGRRSTSTALSLALSLLWVLAAPTALASTNWEPVTLADQGMFYINPATIRREGTIRHFHSALDHKSVQTTSDGKPYWSNETQVQIDCNTRYARVVHLTLFSGKMLSGAVVLKEGILREWQPITPTSAIEKLARRVC